LQRKEGMGGLLETLGVCAIAGLIMQVLPYPFSIFGNYMQLTRWDPS
jgi:hypothetical protein